LSSGEPLWGRKEGEKGGAIRKGKEKTVEIREGMHTRSSATA